jgi:hypothetical protein
MVREGLSSKEIAKATSISVKTVEVHRYNILRKLNLRNAAALVDYINKKACGFIQLSLLHFLERDLFSLLKLVIDFP